MEAASAAQGAHWAFDAAFAAFCVCVAVGRFVMLRRTGAPVGVDAGNWLAMGHALLGDSVRSPSIVYPPVVPVLVLLSSQLLGPLNGIALVGAAASLVPALGAYVLLRGRAQGWLVPILAGLLAVGGAAGEAAAWGGYPQLIGFGLALVFLGLIDTALESGEARRLFLAGVVLALVLATSHFAGLLAVTAGFVLAVHHRRDLRRSGRAVLLIVLPCLPLVPVYVSLVAGLGSSPPSPTLDSRNLVAAVEGLYRDFRWFWRPAFLLALLTPLVKVPAGGDERLRRIVTALVAACVAMTLVTRERRQLYLLAPASVLAVGLWVTSVPVIGARRAMIALVAVFLPAQTVAAVPFFADQRDYYAVLTPEAVAGINWIAHRTPDDALIAVSPAADDWPFSWWVEGLAQRPTLGAAGFRWLYFPDERRRALLGNRIFQSGFPDDASLRLAADSGASFVLVSKAWSGYTAAGASDLRRRHPAAFLLENKSVVILRAGR